MGKRKQIDLSNPEEIRKSKGENQTEFWARFGITQSGGSRYEGGRSPARPTQILMALYLTGKVTDEDLAEAAKAIG
jgi:transcriptional regulator with XRE-family HTH domain